MPRQSTDISPRAAGAKRLAAVLLCALLLPGTALALSSDRDQPVHVRADHFEMDRPHRISTYTGHVVITQGSLRLEADKVVLYQGPDDQLERMVADGKPARFRQRPDGAKYDVTGHALHLEYRVAEHRVDLTRQAHVEQHRDQFNGQHIVYDTLKSVVEASGGNGRVHAIIQPKPKEKGQ